MSARVFVLAFVALCITFWGCGGKVSFPRDSASHEQEGSVEPLNIEEAVRNVRFVAYTPKKYDPTVEPMLKPTRESILKDLRTMKPYFNGIITYGVAHDPSGLIPEVARAEGFKMILGIWDIQSEVEIAIEQANTYSELVVAVCVGNEGLMFKRYDWQTLEAAMERVRQEVPHVSVTTTEPIHLYENPRLIEVSDIVLPNIHAWWADDVPKDDPAQCAIWTVKQADKLRKRTDKPILVKEAGLPSKGHPECSEERQAEFWRTLFNLTDAKKDCSYAAFEFADVPWKKIEIGRCFESYWGFWTENREPKAAVAELQKLE